VIRGRLSCLMLYRRRRGRRAQPSLMGGLCPRMHYSHWLRAGCGRVQHIISPNRSSALVFCSHCCCNSSQSSNETECQGAKAATGHHISDEASLRVSVGCLLAAVVLLPLQLWAVAAPAACGAGGLACCSKGHRSVLSRRHFAPTRSARAGLHSLAEQAGACLHSLAGRARGGLAC
jgi:hypothetical protein